MLACIKIYQDAKVLISHAMLMSRRPKNYMACLRFHQLPKRISPLNNIDKKTRTILWGQRRPVMMTQNALSLCTPCCLTLLPVTPCCLTLLDLRGNQVLQNFKNLLARGYLKECIARPTRAISNLLPTRGNPWNPQRCEGSYMFV